LGRSKLLLVFGLGGGLFLTSSILIRQSAIVQSAPKSRVFEIVGTVAKYYFDGMPSVQLFKRSIVQLIVHN